MTLLSQAPAGLASTPAHWQRTTFGRFARLANGADYSSVEVSEGGYPVYGSGGEFRRAAAYLYDGESVLFGRKGTVDRPLYVSGRFWTVDTMFYSVMDPRHLFPKFVYYWATTLPYGAWATDTALPSMTSSAIKAAPMAVPPVPEQRAIADYLDRETTQIDAFIAKNEEVIALLSERRAAAITRAVTLGLDPTSESREIEWFGAIPSHWEAMALRYLLRTIDQGVSPQAEGGLAEGTGQFGVLKSGCANGGIFRPTEHKLLPDGFEFDRALLVRPGDLLVNRASGSIPLLGSAALVTESRYQLILSDKTFRLTPNDRTTSEYLYWLLNSRIYREQVETSVSGADGLANNLPLSSLRRFVLPLPPTEEQTRIARHLAERTAQIDASIRTAERGIQLARERRAALISAAVAGTIDVGVAE